MMGTSSPKKRRIPIPIKMVIIVVCGFSVVSTIGLQADIAARKHDLADLNARITEQQLQNRKLTAMVEAGKDDQYMEKVAREKWGYVYPDERVFVDVSGD